MSTTDQYTPAWGATSDMNALEALMWRAEADPRLRSQMIAIEVLDTVPDWDRFLAAHDWGSRVVPRFRQKVVEPAMGVGRPVWVVDEHFDLHYHVRRIGVPVPGTFSDVLQVAEQIAMTPFDKARPPWEAALLTGLPDGKAVYLLKLHHSTTDGVGATQLLSMLHSRKREPSLDKPDAPAPEARPESPVTAIVRQVQHDTTKSVSGLLGLAGRGLRALGHPDRAVGEAVGYASSLRRVLADPDAKPSPLLAGRSMTWRFIALDLAFKDLRAAGKPHGASINDAFVAALLGAFRLYHEQLGCPVDAIPMAIPINVRKEGAAAGGNAFAAARLAGPVGVADPLERMLAIGEMVREARDEPAINGIGLISPALSRLPGPIISQLAGGMAKGNDLQASNVPGIREEVFLAGAKIERAYGYAPLPGCAAMITMLSHLDRVCVGANVDPAAITDVDRFGQCLVEGFEEVLALAPGETEPVLRRT